MALALNSVTIDGNIFGVVKFYQTLRKTLRHPRERARGIRTDAFAPWHHHQAWKNIGCMSSNDARNVAKLHQPLRLLRFAFENRLPMDPSSQHCHNREGGATAATPVWKCSLLWTYPANPDLKMFATQFKRRFDTSLFPIAGNFQCKRRRPKRNKTAALIVHKPAQGPNAHGHARKGDVETKIFCKMPRLR